MFLTSLSLLTDRPTTGWRAVARRSSCASISIPNRWRGFLRLQVVIARRLSLLSTHWGRCKLSRQIRPRVRASQADWGNWPGAKAACSRERGPTCQEHGLKEKSFLVLGLDLDAARALGPGVQPERNRMGWERCHTETRFAPLSGSAPPGGLSGWHLGLGFEPGDCGGGLFPAEYGML